jgi:iron(III) transport system substrate-binding protein
MKSKLTRRDFVRLAGGATTLTATGGIGALIQACGGSAPASVKPVEKDVTKLYEAAKKEGSVTWWTAHYEQSAAESMAAAFKTKYPGIEVALTRQTAQILNTRLQQDIKAGVANCDIFCSTDEAHYPPLKKAAQLVQYTPPDLDLLPKNFQVLDPDHYWHLGAIGFVVLNYDSSKVTSPPKSWKDVLDPSWSGKFTTGHPGFSGYVGNWVVAMVDKFGDQYLKDLAKNKPKINRSVNDTVTDIIAHERQVGAGPDNFSLAQKSKGNQIDVVFPSDDAILIAAPVGILANAPHPNTARLFTNFMYSKEYSTALAASHNYPLRSDVAPNGEPALDSIKWYRNKVERLTVGVPEVVDKWRTIMGV